MAAVPTIPICDPHFHFWDHPVRPNENLGAITKTYPTYVAEHLLEDIGPLNVKSVVHVETVVGQVDGGFKLDTVDETVWVQSVAKSLPQKVAIVAFVHLGRPDAAEVIAAHRAAAGSAFVGVRMILNYSHTDPSICWPQVGHDDYLTGGVPLFKTNMELLVKNNLSFDLHCNWDQYTHAATFFRHFPSLQIVIDHMGCPKLGQGEEEDAQRLAAWREGMKAMAALPNVYLKASCMEYLAKDWMKDAKANAFIKGLTHEMINLFGVHRVMFASNFPVDRFLSSCNFVELYTALHALVADLPESDRIALFHDNASRVYKLDG